MADEIKITPQDIMDKLTSLAETMVNLQTQIDGIKVNEKQVEYNPLTMIIQVQKFFIEVNRE